jgi:hypothetical protein
MQNGQEKKPVTEQGKETNKTNIQELLSELLENYDEDILADTKSPTLNRNENKSPMRKVPSGTYAQLSGSPLEGRENISEHTKPSTPTTPKRHENKSPKRKKVSNGTTYAQYCLAQLNMVATSSITNPSTPTKKNSSRRPEEKNRTPTRYFSAPVFTKTTPHGTPEKKSTEQMKMLTGTPSPTKFSVGNIFGSSPTMDEKKFSKEELQEKYSKFQETITTLFSSLFQDYPDVKMKKDISDSDYFGSLSKQPILLKDELHSMYSMPLHAVCLSGDVAKAKDLLESKKFKINDQINSANQTPLYVAVAKFDLRMVQLFVSYGAKIDAYCNNITPLMYAIEHSTEPEHVEVVRFLIESGANVKKNRLLHLVLNKSKSNIHDKEIFTLLVKHGAQLGEILAMERAALRAGNNFIVKLIREEREMLQELQASFLQRQVQQSSADKGLQRFLQVQPQQKALVNQLESSLSIQSSVILMLVMAYYTNVPFNWFACGASFAYFRPDDHKKLKPTYLLYTPMEERIKDDHKKTKPTDSYMPTVDQIKTEFLDAASTEMSDKVRCLETYEDILAFIKDKTNRAELLETPAMEFLTELESRLNESTLPTISLLTSP